MSDHGGRLRAGDPLKMDVVVDAKDVEVMGAKVNGQVRCKSGPDLDWEASGTVINGNTTVGFNASGSGHNQRTVDLSLDTNPLANALIHAQVSNGDLDNAIRAECVEVRNLSKDVPSSTPDGLTIRRQMPKP